jgi:hypothetical protein
MFGPDLIRKIKKEARRAGLAGLTSNLTGQL